MNTMIEELKQDQNLRPYFLDFISKNIVMGMSDIFTVKAIDRTRIQKDFYESYHSLTQKLSERIPNENINLIIEEVSKFYLNRIGHVSFETYPGNDSKN